MITEHFLKLDQTAKIADEGNYHAFNTGSVETEVGEFLYALTRLLKPENCLETGTFHGWSAAYIAQALKENKRGHLETIEYESTHIAISKERWRKFDLFSQITCIHTDSRAFIPEKEYQLLFLDSEPQQRFAELIRFYPFLSPGGYVFLHDLPRTFCQGNINSDHPEFSSWPWGDCPEIISTWVHLGQLRPMYFPNPRSMVGFYKTHPEDYL